MDRFAWTRQTLFRLENRRICVLSRDGAKISLMPSSKNYLLFVLEQLSDLPDVDYRAMMGEFVIYYRGKVIGGIYDNRFLIKPTKSAMAILPDAPMEIPYPGGHPMIMIEDIENREFLNHLISKMYSELPKPKTK